MEYPSDTRAHDSGYFTPSPDKENKLVSFWCVCVLTFNLLILFIYLLDFDNFKLSTIRKFKQLYIKQSKH